VCGVEDKQCEVTQTARKSAIAHAMLCDKPRAGRGDSRCVPGTPIQDACPAARQWHRTRQHICITSEIARRGWATFWIDSNLDCLRRPSAVSDPHFGIFVRWQRLRIEAAGGHCKLRAGQFDKGGRIVWCR
jgi:hypothetical protein